MSSVIKYVLGISWFFVAVLISFLFLRIVTGASKIDLHGYGSLVYILIALIYIILTILFGIYVSKGWFYFILILAMLCIISPFALIFYLNNLF
jgi:accessory gene regulator protein AgrB